MNILNDYRKITAPSFRKYCEVVIDHLSNKYNLTVVEKETVDSNEYIGSFDGESITVKRSLSNDHKLFLIVHLFGHCVQWCGLDADKYSKIEETLPINNDGKVSPEKLKKLEDYEAEAAGYAVQLLNDAVDVNLSQWFADWSHADWNYFVNITTLENKPNTMDIDVKFGTTLIPPRLITDIKLRKISPKYAY